ncbi:hypothetical protein [Salaquimonas pukyongi]|uniref:hypothetical protein n=1 Tax=Salaquimonas pukyongi TaxID=2712698 RepID=UPI0012EC816D|nr:hypothetical protein [Salaquimonas pukyongi]
MANNPALVVVWAVLGLLIGGAMYFVLGGNPYIHMMIGVAGGIVGGSYAAKRRRS